MRRSWLLHRGKWLVQEFGGTQTSVRSAQPASFPSDAGSNRREPSHGTATNGVKSGRPGRPALSVSRTVFPVPGPAARGEHPTGHPLSLLLLASHSWAIGPLGLVKIHSQCPSLSAGVTFSSALPSLPDLDNLQRKVAMAILPSAPPNLASVSY